MITGIIIGLVLGLVLNFVNSRFLTTSHTITRQAVSWARRRKGRAALAFFAEGDRLVGNIGGGADDIPRLLLLMADTRRLSLYLKSHGFALVKLNEEAHNEAH